MWDELQAKLFHGTPEDDRQTHGSQAEGHTGEAATADARGNPGDVGVAAGGGEGVFPLPCDSRERGATEGVSARSEAQLAVDATATQPADALDVGAFYGATRRLATCGGDPASVSDTALRRQASKTGTVCVSRASTGLCGGCRVNRHPYRDPCPHSWGHFCL